MKSALGQVGLPRYRLASGTRALRFGAGLLIATAAALALSYGLLPREAAMPALATGCFVLAAIAAIAAKLRPAEPANRVTLWDVAGALTFIGIFASALIAPEQLVQLTEAGGQRN